VGLCSLGCNHVWVGSMGLVLGNAPLVGTLAELQLMAARLEVVGACPDGGCGSSTCMHAIMHCLMHSATAAVHERAVTSVSRPGCCQPPRNACGCAGGAATGAWPPLPPWGA
jgi:hypothetical protein